MLTMKFQQVQVERIKLLEPTCNMRTCCVLIWSPIVDVLIISDCFVLVRIIITIKMPPPPSHPSPPNPIKSIWPPWPDYSSSGKTAVALHCLKLFKRKAQTHNTCNMSTINYDLFDRTKPCVVFLSLFRNYSSFAAGRGGQQWSSLIKLPGADSNIPSWPFHLILPSKNFPLVFKID